MHVLFSVLLCGCVDAGYAGEESFSKDAGEETPKISKHKIHQAK